MSLETNYLNLLFDYVLALLDVPPSHYEKAAERYQSLGEWLHRKESKVAQLSPEVYPQGSFRYGTVIRPLFETEEYDLDLVCQIRLSKSSVTQKYVKQLVGDEIKAYATAHSFNEPAEEKYRCWRLNYADDVSFHMDILPCVPEDVSFVQQLARLGVPPELAAMAVAITDTRHANYGTIHHDWPSSNPRGFARWFESKLRPYARQRMANLVENRAYASIDDVPPYEWKTILQRCIQILKRHRDVMFKDTPEWKPLSMIITTLATHSYNGEPELYDALTNIVDGMLDHIRPTQPRIPNPLNPKEDFADRWARDHRYEQNFRAWHKQAKADLANLAHVIGKVTDTERLVRQKFALNLTGEMQRKLDAMSTPLAPHITTSTPAVHIATPQKPWLRDG
jgi:hypothetical protein